MTGSLYWQAYIVLQYVIIFGVLFYWVYKKRIQRGFKVQFVAELKRGTSGTYYLDDDKGDDLKRRMFANLTLKRKVTYDVKSGEKSVESVIEPVHGVADSICVFLRSVEVKAGQKLVSYGEDSFMIPWDEICYRDYGWEYMVINVTTKKSLTFGGESCHFYTTDDVQTVNSGVVFRDWVREQALKGVLPMIILAVALAVTITAVVTYFVTKMSIEAGMVEPVAEFVAGRLLGGF